MPFKKGHVHAKRGQGKAYAWIVAHAGHTGKACLPWPFSRDKKGYGSFGHEGRHYSAHRWMCEHRHGPPPSPKHHAAHECGKAHYGCVNPMHLVWKTASENQLDRRKTGRVLSNRYGNKGALSPEQITQIIDLKGSLSQVKIATMMGVSPACIQYWHHEKARRHIDMPEIHDRIDATLAGSPRPVAEVAEALYPGKSCGPGVVTQWLKRRGFKVVDGVAYPRESAEK